MYNLERSTNKSKKHKTGNGKKRKKVLTTPILLSYSSKSSVSALNIIDDTKLSFFLIYLYQLKVHYVLENLISQLQEFELFSDITLIIIATVLK